MYNIENIEFIKGNVRFLVSGKEEIPFVIETITEVFEDWLIINDYFKDEDRSVLEFTQKTAARQRAVATKFINFIMATKNADPIIQELFARIMTFLKVAPMSKLNKLPLSIWGKPITFTLVADEKGKFYDAFGQKYYIYTDQEIPPDILMKYYETLASRYTFMSYSN